MDKVYVVGLTGPTGSGKSEVSRRLTEAQLPVIDADVLARRVVEPGTECLKRLAETFSEDILNDDGSLNRRQLARRAFATPEDTALLNSLTHPYIIGLTNQILMRMEQTHELAAVIDAPLLFESGMDAVCDMTVAVISPAERRLARIMERDGLTEAQARSRMAAQQPETYYTSRAAVVLQNDGDLKLLQKRADALAARVTKTAVSAALPVVGSILSDAASTLAAAAGTLKATIGIFGLLAVAAICLPPVLTLGVRFFVYKLTAAVCECVADKRFSELISNLGTAFALLLAINGAGAMMLFLSLYSLIQTVV